MLIFQHIPVVQRLPHRSLGRTPDPLVRSQHPSVSSMVIFLSFFCLFCIFF